MASQHPPTESLGNGAADFVKAQHSPKTKYFTHVKERKIENTAAAREVYVWINPALSEEGIKDLTDKVINIGGTLSSELAEARFNYQKKLFDLGMDMLSGWTEQLSAATSRTATADPVDSARMLEPLTRWWTINLDFANQFAEVNRKTLDALIKLSVTPPEGGNS
ncbi:MAG TPA: hypothetical protein HPQ04_06775 [Rhodospirillaceae bacterium]|nr:hypothetical protein [Rhodospirillaceae bacterium]